MANIKSAKKDIRRTRKVTDNNHELKARVRNNIKAVDKAVAAGDKKLAGETLKTMQKNIDKATAKGLVKKNTASREKARLNKKVKEMNK